MTSFILIVIYVRVFRTEKGRPLFFLPWAYKKIFSIAKTKTHYTLDTAKNLQFDGALIFPVIT